LGGRAAPRRIHRCGLDSADFYDCWNLVQCIGRSFFGWHLNPFRRPHQGAIRVAAGFVGLVVPIATASPATGIATSFCPVALDSSW